MSSLVNMLQRKIHKSYMYGNRSTIYIYIYIYLYIYIYIYAYIYIYIYVSLTSHVCKVLESIIKDSIINHSNVNNLLNESQQGFISKRSCLTNLLQFIETVTDYVDQGYPVDVILLDFQKVFDKVPHGRLLLKVKAMGIGS